MKKAKWTSKENNSFSAFLISIFHMVSIDDGSSPQTSFSKVKQQTQELGSGMA